jgi:RNA polymerase sigma factor (sigma-70 family)
MADTEFQELIEKAKQGCQAALTRLVLEYTDSILPVIRRYLNKRLGAKVDPEDIQQDVWKSFFRVVLQEQTFESPRQLVAYLLGMARHKTQTVNRRFLELRKNAVDLEEALPEHDGIIDRTAPPPDAVLAAEDDWERFLSKQPPGIRTLLRLWKEGWPLSEIARRLNASESVTETLLARARRQYAGTECP